MKEAKALIEKYKAGTCTPEEMRLIDKWLLETHMGERSDLSAEDFEQISKEVWLNVLAKREQEPAKQVKLWPRIAVAAAAVAAVVFGIWFYEVASSRKAPRNDGTVDMAKVNDIAPGKNGATITMANGKVIQLDSARSGVVVGGDQGLVYNDGTEVASSRNAPRNDDQLNPSSLREPVPTSREGTTKQPPIEMTASTARGQTYQFTLPDGTKVWLNADSKLEFPSSFINSETRNVKLTGEGYFEVAKDKAHPFIVESAGQEVEVLGTHFNINAYDDEAFVKTTLLEGSVAVTSLTPENRKPGQRALIYPGTVLAPGEQSSLSGSNQLSIKNVNAEEAIAWKNNEFVFESESIESIMRRVERWYNVKVVYQGERPKEKFVGGVSRFDNVSKVLKMLESTSSVRFKIEGRTIYVL